MMLDLFKMYQTETVTAPCDGVVSGIDKDSVQLLSDSGQGFVLSFLSNAPNGNDEIQYANYVGKVTAVGQNGWSLLVNPQPIQVTDYTDLSAVPMDEAAMTQVCTYPDTPADEDTTSTPEDPSVPEEGTPPAGETPQEAPGAEPPTPPAEAPSETQLQTVPVYELVNGAWQQISSSSVGTGDILLFAADQSGEFVWIVRIHKASNEPSVPSGGFPTGSMGGYTQTPEPEFEPYSLDMAEIAAVTPQDTMMLEIVIDELDIRHLQVGMTAEITIDALGGEKYTATITEIGNTGTNNGGNSKYTVELTMDRTGDMLSGMNATATVVLATVSDVLTIPADALVERGNETIVYTAYDEESETLQGPVIVKVGCSDGENVEILEGLVDGQTYYYAYYDTLEISLTPEFGAGGFMFG